jgi:hypothetical protein
MSAITAIKEGLSFARQTIGDTDEYSNYRRQVYYEELEVEKEEKKVRLDYCMEEFEEQTLRSYRKEILNILKLIKQYQHELKLYHVKGCQYRVVDGERVIEEEPDIYRLKAKDGYSFDFEISDAETEYGINKVAHVKFIIQPQVSKQGSGYRMQRHVKECANVLFKDNYFYLYGWASGINQFAVRNTRYGDNWREHLVTIKDNMGNTSPPMNRLLCLYLRYGWILAGEKKDGDHLIMFLSPAAKTMLKRELPAEAEEKFKYERKHKQKRTTR